VIAAACRAQARTVISGVGDLLVEYDGDIVFQGGVASNRAVAHYLQEITGNRILIPEHNQIMGAFGAARVARDYVSGARELPRHEAIAYQARYENLSNAKRECVKLADAGCPSQEPLGTDGAVSVPLKGDFAADSDELRALQNAPRRGSDPNAGSKSTDAAVSFGSVKRSIAMRTRLTRREFFSKSKSPLVWRNLFFPAEILNALGVRMLTMETYAALRARSGKKLQELFDRAARKGFSAETCSFLRVLEGDDRLPAPDFIVGTSAPCQQGERVLADLVRDWGRSDRYHLLHTPIHHDNNSVESIAAGLEASVAHLERSLGIRMDEGRLAEACMLSNEARAITLRCNELRSTSPPLMRGGEAILFANMFTQLWGRQELVDLQRTLLEELWEAKKTADRQLNIDDTHRLVWLHLPPFYSSRLLDFIEVTCNAPIVFEEVNSVGWPELDPDDPYRSLARKLLAVGFLDPDLRVQRIRDYAPYAKISGYLLYNHMFGRCSMADSCFIKHVRDELQAINVPLLVLDGDCLDETIDPCSTFTKVRAFIESLNMKKYGSLFGDQSEGTRESAPATLRQPA
jgi:benzoyl-CoA reductase/2-hydroxyglutaryl-CoA dehydratase subunit BcrC/BadD/HgdB